MHVYAAITNPERRGPFNALVWLLAAALLFAGCYSDKYLGRSSRYEPLPLDKSLKVTLFDNSVLEVEPYNYMEVRTPGDYVFGQGETTNTRTGETGEFTGSLSLDEIARTDTPGNLIEVSDTVTVTFEPGGYHRVTREQGTGFFCVGTRTLDGETLPFEGKTPFDEIREIKEVRFNGWATAVLAGGILLTAGIVFTVIAAIELSTGWDSNE